MAADRGALTTSSTSPNPRLDPKLRRGADQSFAELSAASARPDEEPRDYRQLGRRAPRRRAQRHVLDAEHLHRGAASTGPHRGEQCPDRWRFSPAGRDQVVLGGAAGLAITYLVGDLFGVGV